MACVSRAWALAPGSPSVLSESHSGAGTLIIRLRLPPAPASGVIFPSTKPDFLCHYPPSPPGSTSTRPTRCSSRPLMPASISSTPVRPCLHRTTVRKLAGGSRQQFGEDGGFRRSDPRVMLRIASSSYAGSRKKKSATLIEPTYSPGRTMAPALSTFSVVISFPYSRDLR